MINKIKCAIGLHAYKTEYHRLQPSHSFEIMCCTRCGKKVEEIRYYND